MQAAVDAGLLQRSHPVERVLLLANHAYAPEIFPAADHFAGAPTLLRWADRKVSLNDLISPLHPCSFKPNTSELVVWSRVLCDQWGIDADRVELVVPDLESGFTPSLAAIFHQASITVLSSDFRAYTPPARTPPLSDLQRLQCLLYVPLLPWLQPMFAESVDIPSFQIPSQLLADLETEASRATDAFLPAGWHEQPEHATALVVGQNFVDEGILAPADETALFNSMMEASRSAGATRVLFSQPAENSSTPQQTLQGIARRLGMTFACASEACPAELLLRALKPAWTVSCFSPVLLTAQAVPGVEVIAAGTRLIFEKLSPYHHCQRIPLSLTEAVFVDRLAPEEASALIRSVAYTAYNRTMQASRPAAEHFIGKAFSERSKYFNRRRLETLGLLVPPKKQRRNLLSCITQHFRSPEGSNHAVQNRRKSGPKAAA